MKASKIILILILIASNLAVGQQKENQIITKDNNTMKTYVIERIIPGAGDLTPKQLKGVSQTSCAVLKDMGSAIEWQHSYVTGDKVYCIYKAESKALIKQHAEKSGIPVNSINELAIVINPETAEM